MKNYDENYNTTIENKENSEGRKSKKSLLKKGLTIGLCTALAGGMVLGGMQGLGSFSAREVVAAENKGPLDVTDVVDVIMPSLVSITTKTVQEVRNYFDYGYGFSFFGYGFGDDQPQTREVTNGGSGIIIGKNDTELLLVTNYHVVEGTNTITVAFINEAVNEAKVKGYDEDKDIAIIAIPLDDLSDDTIKAIAPAKLGSSDDLKVGEQVVVVGNAMGYGQSVTTGIVSAKNRQINASPFVGNGEVDETAANLIQTDAAINPGNSGGAMVNMDGEVVGIASEKLANYLIEGMCYAIAISDVEDELEDIATQETRELLADDEHGVLGITGATVTEQESFKYGAPQGIIVVEVTEDGPADDAGLEPYSIITQFNGRSVKTIEKLVEYLKYYEPGEEVELTVYSPEENGYEKNVVTVTLGEQEPEEEEELSDGEETEEKSQKKTKKARKNTEDARKSEDTEDTEETEADEDAEDGEAEDEENADSRTREDVFAEWEKGIFNN